MTQYSFQALILSYKTAPLELREEVALDEKECKQLIEQINDFTEAQDVLVLSTCNRTEIYYSSLQDINLDILKLLGILKNIPVKKFQSSFRHLQSSVEAIKQLFRVSLGLEAQVVGDMQITNQVKNAYQWSADADMAGPFLHRLMHTIFFSNKRVVQETPFRDGAASVSYATVELIEDLTKNIATPKILILGLGEMGTDVVRNLTHIEDAEVYICNRTHSKALNLAKEYGYNTIAFDQFHEIIYECDVVVSSIRADDPVISFELIENEQFLSIKHMIDMSVPRSIDERVEQNPGVALYNIDQIKNRASLTLEKRKEAIPQVEGIVIEAINDFSDWTKEMEVSPTIHKLKNALEQIRRDEINRHIKKLSNEEAENIEIITKNIMQKIIKLPVLQLKAACKRDDGEAETLIDVLNNLFNLEASTQEKSSK